MNTPHRTRQIALAASLALLAGCGGEPPIVDNATTIPPESAKPVPEAAPANPTPEATKK